MARTKSTARKSGRGGYCHPGLNPHAAVAGPDVLNLLLSWLVVQISKHVTKVVESDEFWLSWFPFLSSLCVPKTPEREVIRTISATLADVGDYGEQQSNEHNLLLQEAVSAFIEKNFAFQASRMFYELVDDPECDVSNQEDESYASASLVPKLARPGSQWLRLTPNIDFQYVAAGQVVHYQFRSSHPHGSEKIDRFITHAFELHQQLEAKRVKEATERYHYERLETGSVKPRARSLGRGRRGRARRPIATRQPQSMQICKRYRLADSTTLSSLFFEGKAQLIQTLDDFQRRAGKFAPRRFAHRMGIFLHGPSGSGKTSIAKAVAYHANRHIVNVHASQLKTNKEVTDLLQDFSYSVPSLGLTVELDYTDVVLVLEGVDEIGFAPTDGKSQARSRDLFTDFPKSLDEDESDVLTVHGFLSALDGMVDTPGRVVVMTAIDPRRVAPGLLRPGRVHANLDLSIMSAKCIQEMIEHYLDTTLSADQAAQLQAIAESEAKTQRTLLTPAEMEAICLESQDVTSILRNLSASE